MVELISANTTRLDSMDQDGNFPLLTFTRNDIDIDIIETLIKNGARPISGNQNNWTPLHEAAKLNLLEILDLFVTVADSVDPISSNGLTPAMVSVIYNNPQALSILKKSNADMTIKCNFGKTVKDYALEKKCNDVLNVLNLTL